MAGYKETPRQKLIGMLYLVLTALLALNVSKDILDAFMVVNDTMVSTNQNFATKISGTYGQFEYQYGIEPDKVKDNWEKAQEVRERSQELISYIKELKLELVAATERKTEAEALNLFYDQVMVADPFNPGQQREMNVLNLNKVKARDKYDAVTAIMIGQNKNGKAYDLSEKMQDYRNFILDVVGPRFADNIALVIDEGDAYTDATGQRLDWQHYNFYRTIIAASVTILNKIISEVQSAEFDAINRLYANITETDFKFDNIAARVIPKSTYVLTGQNYEAEVLLAAYESTEQIEARILRGADRITPANRNNAQVFRSSEGVVSIQFPAGSPGTHRYAGVIEKFDPATQTYQDHHFNGEFTVAPPALTVAPLRMNIVYADVRNPISLSAPGIPTEAITPRVSEGELSRNPDGTWDVLVPEGPRTITVSASANIDGRTIQLEEQEFRVRRVPLPTAKIANVTEGEVNRNSVLAAAGIYADLGDFDFEGYSFTVESFEVNTMRGGDFIPLGRVTGNRFSPAVISEIQNARRGQRFFFENIRAVGPGGTVRGLNAINLIII